jgi:hypothetical protein
MYANIAHRFARATRLAAAIVAILAVPFTAAASGHSHFQAGPSFGRDADIIGRDGSGGAPEIDSSVLGQVSALLAGGLALLGRRRSRS